jgi:hypothetical protein
MPENRPTFVAQHQCHRQQPIFATEACPGAIVHHLQSIDEQEGEKNDILGDLCGDEERLDPFPKRR